MLQEKENYVSHQTQNASAEVCKKLGHWDEVQPHEQTMKDYWTQHQKLLNKNNSGKVEK